MRLGAAEELAFRGLARGAVNSGVGFLVRMGEAAFKILATAGASPAFGPSPQLPLWCGDGRPFRLLPGERFYCAALTCDMSAGGCVARQVENEKNLRKRKTRAEAPKAPSRWQIKRYRGKCPEYPSCQTHLCAQGREIRDRVGSTDQGE